MLLLRKFAACAAIVGLSLSFSAQSAVSPDGLWSDISAKSAAGNLFEYRSLSGNTAALIDQLKKAPVVGSTAPGLELYLPLPDNSYVRVSVYKTEVMSAALAEKFPEIQTFKVRGLDDTSVSGSLDFGPNGLHGMLLSSKGTIYIEPESSFSSVSNKSAFRSFNKQAYPRPEKSYKCSVEGHDHTGNELDLLSAQLQRVAPQSKSAGSKRRTYRLAVGATAEYTAAVSSGTPTVAKGQAAIVTAIARLNEVYEKEVAVSFTLVGNNSSIVFTDTATDGYTNNSGSTMLGENQTKLDAIIGAANYDIGHVFSTGGGGVASIASVCDDASDASIGSNRKARGVTGLPNPVGDPFVVDYVAHEVGHQFGAPHTFNAGGNTSGSCDDANRENHTSTVGGGDLTDSAYEPGSGSTIMAYAGICSPQNIQNNSDAYFHARSLEQIRDFVENKILFSNTQGGSCGVETNTGDTEPVVEAGANYTIPGSTPFALTGNGSDIDAGDTGTLIYTWEQFDLGTKTTTLAEMHADADTRPLFRSYTGTSSPTRYFPALTAILSGSLESITGERLPTTDRDMKFRLTVRSGAQGFNQDDMTVTVDKDAGPLVVTAPAAASTFSGASDTTVTWDVANTTAAPVSCANMAISYSTDSGQNFDTTLLASTPNDGTQAITLPNTTTTQARIKVQCQNNIFFNVSPGDFNVNAIGSLAISALSAVKAEGNSATTAYTFNVVRSGSTTGTASATYTVSGTGANPADTADFGGAFPTGTVSFTNGESSKSITINVTGDTVAESDEAFEVVLSTPVDASIATASASGTIQNDDASVSIVATSAAKSEGDTGTTAFTFTVSRTGNTIGSASASYAVTSTAADGADFGGSFPTGSVSFASGVTSQVITVNVSGDTEVEMDEAFVVTLSSPVGVEIGTAAASGTIQNDDDTISIVATSATKAEGDAGNTAFTFTVNRTGNTASAVSASYAVTSTAADGTDFGGSFPAGTVSFASGVTTQVITVNVSGDTAVEADEAFDVTLSAPVSTVIGTAVASGSIQNDDDTLSIVTTSATKAEGDTGTTAFTFTVSRTGNTASTVSASYAVSGAAVDAADFGGSLPSGTVSFPSGVTSQVITVNVSGDTAVETDEAFTVTLSSPVSTVIGTAAANGTIQNDDESLAIAATSAVNAEGDSGNTAFTFTVSRTGNTSGTASASYAVTSAAANAADFGGTLPTGTVNFSDGDSSEIITINVSGDTAVESDEAFTITLSAPVSTAIGTASAGGTIQNDDESLAIAATSAVNAEGDAGNTAFTFTVSRTGNTSGTASASYAVSSATATGADFGGSFPTGTVNFSDGDNSEVITINVSGDTEVESNEAFTVTLSSPVSTVIGTAAANGTIENDDASVSISTTPVVQAEGQSGSTAFTFTVTRIVDLSSAASVDYAVTGAGVNAANAADFGASFPTGTVNFANGVSEQTITVNVAGDTVVETDENFLVTISNPMNTVINEASVTATIQNDDASVSIAATSADKAEGQSGNTAYTFTVTRTGNTTAAATVGYAVTGSSAFQSAATDFVGGALPSGTASFAGGAASAVITVNVAADTLVEEDEGFTVTLNAPSAGTIIGTASANGTIQNDDASVSIAATSAVKAEGQSGTTAYTFTATRSGNITAAATVAYAVTGASAADFDGGVLPSGIASFAGGASTALITINVAGDAVVESDEDFTVTLSSPSVGTVISTASANGTIQNDDASVSIAAAAAVQAEGQLGDNTNYTFSVTRTGNIAAAASVNYAVTGASADDFLGGAFPTGTVNFSGGVNSALVTVTVVGDAVVEGDENFTVTLATPSAGMVIGTSAANGIIQNDDASLSVAATSAVKVEGQTGSTAYTFTVTRTGSTSGTASANYAVTSAAANAADFGGTLPTGTVNFAGGDSSEVITINVSGDTEVESDEAFTVTLNTPVNTVINTASANGTIQNDDASLAIAATSATNAEGQSSTANFTFTVTRTGDTTGAATVAYAVTGSGANAADADDFGGTLPSGTLNFAGGSNSEVITIAVSGDTDVEVDEGFTVTLSGPSAGAIVATATANGVIQNDDAALTIAATTADQFEGNSATTNFTFTVTRTGNTTGTASASYAVTGSDVDPADFGGSTPSGTVNFAANETDKVITIAVSGDTDNETLERFDVTLSAPSVGTVITTAVATGLIKNDDGPVSYSVTALAADQAEGNTGATPFTFSIVRSGAPSVAVEQITYTVTGSGSNAATAADFDGGFATGQVNFAVGAHTVVQTINVAGDVEFEPSEGFTVTLSNAPVSTTISQATAEGVIQNDDAALSIAATSVVKSSNNMYTFTFTVTRTAGAVGASSVEYAVTGSGTNPVVAADFGGSLPSGTVNFAAGQNTAVVSITVAAATTAGSDKNFTVTLSNPVNASLAGTIATGVIKNDVTAPALVASGGGGGSFGWLMLALLMSFIPLRKQR